MSDKELIKIIKQFVKGMLGKKSTESQCFVVCLPLQSYLSFCGVETELTEGEISFTENVIHHHYWLTMKDGRIIDPTANQFTMANGERLQNFYCEQKPIIYKELNQNHQKQKMNFL